MGSRVDWKLIGMLVIAFVIGYSESETQFLYFIFHHKITKSSMVEKVELSTIEPKTYNKYSLYSDITKKILVDCPDNKDSLVIFAFGQSNSANRAGSRSIDSSGKIVNFFNGKCYKAVDPLLGATGAHGNLWIPMAQGIETDKDIVLITTGIDGTSVNMWVAPHDLHEHLSNIMNGIKIKGYEVDLFIWVQGEADKFTNIKTYTQNLEQLIAQTKTEFPQSKFSLTGTSFCNGEKDSNIVNAQYTVTTKIPGVYWLGETDQFTNIQYRYDDCHYSKEGVDAISKMISDKICASGEIIHCLSK